MARAARLHFEFGLTHQEVADNLGISRVKVTRLLKQARESGMVRIVVDTGVSVYSELEQQLTARFGLSAAILVPSQGPKSGDLRTVLAQGAAAYMTRVLRDGMVVAVGLSRTIGEMARQLSSVPQSRRAVTFVSLAGALREGGAGDDSPFGAATTLARAFGGSVEHLHAPIIVRSKSVAKEVSQDPAISPTLKRAANADILFVGVAGKNDRIDLSGQGYIEKAEWNALVAAGMVGDICARFFDKDGREIDNELSSRVIGLGLGDLKKIPVRVIAGGGATKRDAVRAVLNGGLATVLVTDVETARDLLIRP
jgi:DNA-binding transcriptional regulator LsrR (DeoR family)